VSLYRNKLYSINQKNEGTEEDRGRNGGTNFILRSKEQETRLILQENDNDDDDDDYEVNYEFIATIFTKILYV
jgi:hypothetical protein